MLQSERTILRLARQRPHPHIIEPIDTDQLEGIYLRRYHSLSEDKIPAQHHRIRWYRDLTDALCHIHSLGIAHADIRIDNVLLDEYYRAILCDFSAANPLGQSNPVFLHLPLPINGPSPTLSEATDRFATASLIFRMEHGVKLELSVDSNGILVLPEIQTGHPGLDTIIGTAWLAHYSRTSQMQERLDSIDTNGARPAHDVQLRSGSMESWRDRIKEWRRPVRISLVSYLFYVVHSLGT